MDILFKPRVEATEQMTQSRTIFCIPRINESAKSRVSDMYVIIFSCFHSFLHQEPKPEGTYVLSLRLSRFLDIMRMPQNVALKIYKRIVSSACFCPMYPV